MYTGATVYNKFKINFKIRTFIHFSWKGLRLVRLTEYCDDLIFPKTVVRVTTETGKKRERERTFVREHCVPRCRQAKRNRPGRGEGCQILRKTQRKFPQCICRPADPKYWTGTTWIPIGLRPTADQCLLAILTPSSTIFSVSISLAKWVPILCKGRTNRNKPVYIVLCATKYLPDIKQIHWWSWQKSSWTGGTAHRGQMDVFRL